MSPAKKAAWPNVALAASATVVALLAAELALFEPHPDRREVIRDLRGRGVRVYPAVAPLMFLRSPIVVAGEPTLPLGGISGVTTVDCKEGGDWRIYPSDEHGFPNPAGLWDAPALDILALGDSFTAGSCVPSGEDMVGLVRRAHPATLNLACGGNGPLLMLAGLREYLPALRPRTVLWGYFAGNDLLDLRFENRNGLLLRSLDEEGFTQGLLRKQEAIDRSLASYADERIDQGRPPAVQAALDLFLLRHLRARVLLWLEDRVIPRDRLKPRREAARFATTDEEYALFGTILEKATRAVEARGGRLSFVYLPSWSEVSGAPRIGEIAEERRRRVLALVRGLALPLIDALPPFASHAGKDLFACRYCHYSAQGHAVAARTILEALRKDGSPTPTSATDRP